jgi:polyphosphate kinase
LNDAKAFTSPAALRRPNQKDTGAGQPVGRSNGRTELIFSGGEVMATAAKTKSKHKNGKKDQHSAATNNGALNNGTRPPMTAKEFERELEPLQVELVKLQEWVKATGAKICIVFEGRDAAGKGGTIKRIAERVSPRVFRVIALPAPTEREKSQMYIQRYLPHLPAAGEVVIFDRSWYNRSGVERVMGYATQAQVDEFLRQVEAVERAMVDSGIILIKYWLEVGQEEQTRRLQDRINDGRKTWKLSPMDLESYGRWYDYSRARDAMFAASDSPEAPWYVIDSNEKRRARLNCIAHLLSVIPYKEIPQKKVTLPKRQTADGYVEPDYPYRLVPQRY